MQNNLTIETKRASTMTNTCTALTMQISQLIPSPSILLQLSVDQAACILLQLLRKLDNVIFPNPLALSSMQAHFDNVTLGGSDSMTIYWGFAW